MRSERHFTSPRPALAVLLMLIVAILMLYQQIYATSQQQLSQTRKAYENIAWVFAAAPEWRQEYAQQLAALRANRLFVTAPTLQDAEGAFQASLRQAIAAAGASIDALQVTTVPRDDELMPAIRATITLRAPAAAVISVLNAIETMTPRIAIESLDIAASGASTSPQPMVITTVTVRSYAMDLSDAVE